MPEEQLAKLKRSLGIAADNIDKDVDLTDMLDDAKSDLLTWTNRVELPVELLSTQRQIVVIRYNMLGIEGQTTHSVGGISRSFEDLPDSIKATIASRRISKLTKMVKAGEIQ